MSTSTRKQYLTSTVLTQQFLDQSHDNLINNLELVCDIQAPDGSMIHASDRNKYLGNTFYEALLTFPSIKRTLGEWLVNEIEFSELRIELSNVDGRFNKFLPTGPLFQSWVGNTVEIRVGLRDVASTYFTIFKGRVTQIGGFGRTISTINISARDNYDKLNVQFPKTVFGKTNHPRIDNETQKTFVPIIYGDWTTAIQEPEGSVLAFLMNALDPMVDSSIQRDVSVTVGAADTWTLADHFFNTNDKVQLETSGALPSGYSPTTDYFVSVLNSTQFRLKASAGGPAIGSASAGSGQVRVVTSPNAVARNLEFVTSENSLSFFDQTKVFLKRGETRFQFASADIQNIGAGLNTFEVKQKNGVTLVEGLPYVYKSGDDFFVRVKGKALGYNDNLVWQARDILLTYGGVSGSDLDTVTFQKYRDKATPIESATGSFKSRVWVNEQSSVIQYVLSMFEQVRLEMFTSSQFTLKLSSLHLDEFSTAYQAPKLELKNWDIERNSLKLNIDDKNNFNRIKGAFGFLPNLKENGFTTPVFKNTASIAQIGREVSKQVAFPNLYQLTDATSQTREILKLASGFFELIDCSLTWRSLLLEPGDMCKLTVTIGSTRFENVPVLVRSLAYEPGTLKLPTQFWSLQMVSFGSWSPGYTGMTGGSAAVIVQE